MKGKTGNLIIILREGESVHLDGPGSIHVKEIRKNKVAVMIDADDETTIKRRSKEVAKHKKEDAKE